MKNSRTLRMLFYLIFFTAISSCASDDEMQQDDALLGVWELSSSNDSYYYRLVFLPDYAGYWEDMSFGPPDFEYAIGGAANFTWSTTDNPKKLIIPDMELNSPYSINAEGQLIINDLQKGLPFNKLDSSN